jgi:hypothetical protein
LFVRFEGLVVLILTHPLSPPPPPRAQDWPGILLLEFPNAIDTYKCTGVVIYVDVANATAIVLTSGTCIPQTLRSSNTGSSNFYGANAALGPAFRILAGDPGRTHIGYSNETHFVFSAVQGFNLALVTAVLDTAALATLPASLVAYPWIDDEIPLWAQGRAFGYGADNVTVRAGGLIVTSSGVGTLRSTPIVITDVSVAMVPSDGHCVATAAGGEVYIEDLGGSYNKGRMCVTYGDDGAPVFLNVDPRPGFFDWKLAGVVVSSNDLLGCGGSNAIMPKYTLTSTVFRNSWIRGLLANLTKTTYVKPPCPSAIPSSGPSPSRTPIPQWAASQTPTRTPSASPIPYVEQPLNLLWIIIMSVFLFTVLACTVYWGMSIRARMRGHLKVAPKLKEELSKPSVGQIASSELMPSEYEAERTRRASVAREGGLVVAPRRMSQAPTDVASLAAVEAARKDRKERRRSQIAIAEAEQGNPAQDGAGGEGAAGDEDGANPALGGGGAAASPKPARRTSVAQGRRASAAQQRRRSLVQTDRQYDQGGPVAGATIAYRFNYERHEKTREEVLALGLPGSPMDRQPPSVATDEAELEEEEDKRAAEGGRGRRGRGKEDRRGSAAGGGGRR